MPALVTRDEKRRWWERLTLVSHLRDKTAYVDATDMLRLLSEAEALHDLAVEALDELCDGDPMDCTCRRVNAGGETVVAPYSGECLRCRLRDATTEACPSP